MRILDLFCGAGGAAMGLHAAFPAADILGVDIQRQPRYPFKQLIQDVTELSDVFLASYDFVWASPPCQSYTRMKHLRNSQGKSVRETARKDWISVLRGKVHVIENVPGAPLDGIILCGSMFGLRVRRHRIFECKFPIQQLECQHKKQGRPVGVWNWGKWGHKIKSGGKSATSLADAMDAMGITHKMGKKEICEAIPPAYSKYIGEQFKRYSISN